MDASDVPLDDSVLLQDRLLRSLHRNRDGHLASSLKDHGNSVLREHNIATLYVYSADEDSYTLHEHYVYSPDSLNYQQWLKVVIRECFALEDAKLESYYGVYGWLTSRLRITPLRNGDLFIKIDSEGATGVRLTFDTGAHKLETYRKKKPTQK